MLQCLVPLKTYFALLLNLDHSHSLAVRISHSAFLSGVPYAVQWLLPTVLV